MTRAGEGIIDDERMMQAIEAYLTEYGKRNCEVVTCSLLFAARKRASGETPGETADEWRNFSIR